MTSGKRFDYSDVIVTLTTLIFALTSLITVYISLSAWREERQSIRPYLTIGSPKIIITDKLSLNFELYNVGVNPAADLHCQTIFLPSSPDSAPLHIDQYSLGGYLTKNSRQNITVTTGNDFNSLFQKGGAVLYIIISFKYNDPVLKKEHEQIIYLKWPGQNAAQSTPIFHASKEDKDLILKYLMISK